jgi:universal stress protein A
MTTKTLTKTLPARRKPARLSISKILVPSDFSTASDNAFKYALRFGQEFGADLFLIHVLELALAPTFAGVPDAPGISRDDLSLAEENLRAWVDSAHAAGVNAKLALRSGLPAHEIVEAAKDHDVDLVIIATHGYTGWKHFCIGSTAEKVVRAAPCPVLVVREKEHDFV